MRPDRGETCDDRNTVNETIIRRSVLRDAQLELEPGQCVTRPTCRVEIAMPQYWPARPPDSDESTPGDERDTRRCVLGQPVVKPVRLGSYGKGGCNDLRE